MSDSGKSCRRVSQGVFDSVYMTRPGLESKIEADRQLKQICFGAQLFGARSRRAVTFNLRGRCLRRGYEGFDLYFLRSVAAARQFIFIDLNRLGSGPVLAPGRARPVIGGRISNRDIGPASRRPLNSARGACCIGRALPV